MSFSAFDKASTQRLIYMYHSLQFNPNNKNDISKYVKSFPVQLRGRAAAREKDHPFSGHVVCTKFFIKLLEEVDKHIDELFPNDSITLFECRISNVMLFGILREIDIFCRCSTIHWTHVVDSCTVGTLVPLGYQYEYFTKHFPKYINIVSDVHDKENSYSFMKDVTDLKQKNSDMVLYANQQSFLNFLNPNNLSKTAMQHLEYGVWGFNFFTWLVSLWDDYRHVKYLEKKDFKAWLESRVALLRLELANTDPNSAEYLRLVKIIQAYDAKIADYDRKLSKYENE